MLDDMKLRNLPDKRDHWAQAFWQARAAQELARWLVRWIAARRHGHAGLSHLMVGAGRNLVLANSRQMVEHLDLALRDLVAASPDIAGPAEV